MTGTDYILTLIFIALVVIGLFISSVAVRGKHEVEAQESPYEQVAQPRVGRPVGVHAAPTWHLQAHHDQILLRLRSLEEKVDLLLEGVK